MKLRLIDFVAVFVLLVSAVVSYMISEAEAEPVAPTASNFHKIITEYFRRNDDSIACPQNYEGIGSVMRSLYVGPGILTDRLSEDERKLMNVLYSRGVVTKEDDNGVSIYKLTDSGKRFLKDGLYSVNSIQQETFWLLATYRKTMPDRYRARGFCWADGVAVKDVRIARYPHYGSDTQMIALLEVNVAVRGIKDWARDPFIVKHIGHINYWSQPRTINVAMVLDGREWKPISAAF